MSNDDAAALRERMARLEEFADNQAKRMDIVQNDIRAIRTALDQMNGGRRLVMGIFAAIGALAATVAAITGITALIRMLGKI